MNGTSIYSNVHGVEEFYIVFDTGDEGTERDEGNASTKAKPKQGRSNIPAFATTVQKTKRWVSELMVELQWQDAQKAYHALRVVLHALRDRLTLHEMADVSAQLPTLIRGMFFEGWQPSHAPVKDRSQQAFFEHVLHEFPNDSSIDPERLTRAVLSILSRHVSQGEIADIKAILPKPLRELMPKE